MASMVKIAGREGSNAGRGFRYQDAVTAWLAVRIWAGDLPRATVVPEGGDDVELRGHGGVTLVQVKSRRPHLGPLPVAEARKYLQYLWARDLSAVGFELIVEQGVAGMTDSASGAGAIQQPGPLNGFPTTRDNAPLLARTRIVGALTPLEDSVGYISSVSACSPLAAQIAFAQILSAVGTLADENGRRAANECHGLSISDADRIISETLAAIDSQALEAAIRDGACEAVDFLTPLDDPEFLMGVDVQPGHIAAGLVVSRTEATEAVSAGLSARRAVLVAGPSGSGKSAIMWDAARALSHSIRWYRLTRVDRDDLPVLRRLAMALRASPASPVGFIVDDAGRRGVDGWDALARELSVTPGLLLLGSIREEDLFLLADRARLAEVRAEPDDRVAEQLFNRLSATGKTSWGGWREPWRLSQGLMLEYAHILTAGERFDQTLADQVAARLRDPARDPETAILRVAAMAGAAAASVDLGEAAAELGIGDTAAARALARLVDEHLVRVDDTGRVTGLHQLRSARLLSLTHAPPRLENTLATAILCVPPPDLERLTAAAIAEWNLEPASVVASLAARLVGSPDPEALAAALRGLGAGQIAAGVGRWLASSEASKIVRTQIGTAAMFGISGVPTPEMPQLADVAAAANLLTQIKSDVAYDTRRLLIEALGGDAIAATIAMARTPARLDEILSALVGHALPQGVRSALQALEPDVLEGDLEAVARLLGTLALLDRELAIELAGAVGPAATIGRIAREMPWATDCTVRDGPEGVEAGCDYRIISEADQPEAHDDVVRLCELALALAPEADLAVARAVTPDGNVAGFGGLALADKRIRRDSLPPAAMPEWNRRWRDAVGNRVAATSYTDYLSRARSMLERLVPTLERTIEAILRNKDVSNRLVEDLNALNGEAETLTPPKVSPMSAAGTGSESVNNALTPLQDAIFNATVNLSKRFHRLPEGSGSLTAWCAGLIEHARQGRQDEPWHILAEGAPASLDRLEELLFRVRALAGEANVRDERPSATWRQIVSKARPGNALRAAASAASSAATRRRLQILEDARQRLAEAGIAARVFAADDPEAQLPWPPTQFLVLTDASDIAAAIGALDAAAAAARDAIGQSARITVAPVVDDRIVSVLALTGITSLLPLPVGWSSWQQAGVPAAQGMPALTIFDGAASAATSLAAMDMHHLGIAGRPGVEISVRQLLEARLTAFRDDLAEEVPLELLAEADGFLSRMRSGEFRLPGNVPSDGDELAPELLELLDARVAVMQSAVDAAPGEKGP
jgi:hypothetical protein